MFAFDKMWRAIAVFVLLSSVAAETERKWCSLTDKEWKTICKSEDSRGIEWMRWGIATSTGLEYSSLEVRKKIYFSKSKRNLKFPFAI